MLMLSLELLQSDSSFKLLTSSEDWRSNTHRLWMTQRRREASSPISFVLGKDVGTWWQKPTLTLVTFLLTHWKGCRTLDCRLRKSGGTYRLQPKNISATATEYNMQQRVTPLTSSSAYMAHKWNISVQRKSTLRKKKSKPATNIPTSVSTSTLVIISISSYSGIGKRFR